MTKVQFAFWIASILLVTLIGLVVTRKEHARRDRIATRRESLCGHGEPAYRAAWNGWPCPYCLVDGRYGIGRYAKFYPVCARCGNRHDEEKGCTLAIAHNRAADSAQEKKHD